MRIRCVILRRNRNLKTSDYPQERGFFRFNKGIYLLRKEDVNLRVEIDKKRPYKSKPELYFIEGHPIPLGVSEEITYKEVVGKDGKTVKIPNPTKASAFLDNLVISNALKETGKPRGLFWEVVGDYMKKPFNLLILVFAFIVLVTFLLDVIHL